MSTDLRDQLEQAFVLDEQRVPAASSLWRRGRLQRRRRTAAFATAGLVGLMGLAVVASSLPGIGETPSVPYVDAGPHDPGAESSNDPLDLVEVEPLPPGELDAVRRNWPPESPGPDEGGLTMQDEILSDGLVTADEYREAMDATVACVADHGYEAEVLRGGGIFDPSITPGTVLTHVVVVPDDRPDPSDLLERCRAQWSWQVEQVWLAQIMPPAAEQERAWDDFWQCIRDQGIADEGIVLSDPPNPGDVGRVMHHAETCLP